MDSNTDTPVVEVLPMNTSLQGEEAGMAVRETPAEEIVNVPVAPVESTVLQLHPTKENVTGQVKDTADGDVAIIPAIVHVAIADDLTSGKSEPKSDSLITGAAAVAPTLTEIHVDTSAIQASPSSSSAQMNSVQENARIAEQSFTYISPADNDQDPIHSNIVTTLHDSTQSTQDDQLAEGKETLTERLQGTDLAYLSMAETAFDEHPGQVSGAGLDVKMADNDCAVETPPIPSLPEQALMDHEDTDALRQASSSTEQTDELPAYGDSLMVQEAALLDIGEDPQTTLNMSDTKSPLIGEIDYSEIMENQQNDTDSIPMEHQNINDDQMVQEAALLDVQNRPPSFHTQQNVFGELGDGGLFIQNNLPNELHNERIADEYRESFTAESQMKLTESNDHIIISVDDDTDSGEGSIEEEIARADSLARKRPRVEPQLEPFSKPPGHRPPMPVTNHVGLSIGSARLPVVPPQRPQSIVLNTPEYLELHNFTPTWNQLLPSPQKSPKNERRLFRLSLLNVNEFTIIGLPVQFGRNPTPIAGLRASIKAISREHGKAVYERDADGSGKWRIPLGAYHGTLL
jgi:hypothetical protein